MLMTIFISVQFTGLGSKFGHPAETTPVLARISLILCSFHIERQPEE